MSTRAICYRPNYSVVDYKQWEGLPEQHIDYAPSLIAEILSPSTEHKDRTAKRELYAQQGVKYYLLVDPTERLIEVLHLCDTGYVKSEIASDVFSLTVHENCHVELQTSSIFPLSRER